MLTTDTVMTLTHELNLTAALAAVAVTAAISAATTSTSVKVTTSMTLVNRLLSEVQWLHILWKGR